MVPTTAFLIFENGDRFQGKLLGCRRTSAAISGECVFQTGHTGYVEALTDPSYCRQILIFTFPLLGNNGVPKMGAAAIGDHNDDEQQQQQNIMLINNNGGGDGFESSRIWPCAIVVGNISDIGSHWDSYSTLADWLDQQGVPALVGVDTRKLTKLIRTQGAMRAKLVSEADEAGKIEFVTIAEANLVAEVSRKAPIWLGLNKERSGARKSQILVIDIGLKANQVRCLLARNCALHIVPWNFPFHIEEYDGLFVSNGPGDPGHVCLKLLIQQLSAALTAPNSKPIFAICLGHQLVARAIGLSTKKMKFGNRGHNLPIIHTDTGRCFITAQNHGYAVEDDKQWLPSGWHQLFWNANDHSNEGLIHESQPFFSVQFHPEHAGGPTDLECLFDIFVAAVHKNKVGEKINVRQEIQQKFATNIDKYREKIGIQRKVLILGSGGLSIGQAGEFDYSVAQAIKALKEMRIKTVLVNANIATYQTTKGFADRVYFLPITEEVVSEIIEKERPTGILCTFGGQTALNCALALHKKGVFEKFNCHVLGTSMDAILCTEDRDMFRVELEKIGERVAPSKAATTLEEAEDAAQEIGYPVLVRAAFALGGLGSGFANNREELTEIATHALDHSEQILIDKSVRGWKEIEYEVVRDAFDNCITVCNMENIDPVGIHTGESVVVAPSQTLNNEEYFGLRKTALRVIRHFGIVGECNIQYALNPEKFEYYIIEVNARLSRSSALASKATGYPLAFVAAKLALGASLPELRNMVTGGMSTACFEPALDYCVVKVPRWDLNKFSGVNTKIGSSMKSVGEAMAIGRTFEESLQKAFRMANDSYEGFSPDIFNRPVTKEDLEQPTDKRMFAIARFLRYGDERRKENNSGRSSSNEDEGGEEDEWAHILAEEAAEEKLRAENGGNDYGANAINKMAERVHKVTGIDRWFLARMCSIVGMYSRIEKAQHTLDLTVANKCQNAQQDVVPSVELIKEAKQIGFSDAQIARLIGKAERTVREWRRLHGIVPFVKQIDTVAGEWPATTNYLYLTYNAQEHDVEFNEQQDKAVMVLGSGVYRIGSSVEFDACAVGCVKTLDKLGHKTIMINCNPETVSTDYDICNRLYFEEISLEVVSTIYELEMPLGAILAFGGQAANNIALSLDSPSLTVPIKVLGTSPKCIDEAEDRFKFSRILDDLDISQPKWRNAASEEEAVEFCAQVGYPCLIRPSYVLSGAAMAVAHNEKDLREYLKKAKFIARDKPVVVSQFIEDAKEIDVDVVCIGGRVLEKAISEHIENAGIHSGDATLVTPPQDLTAATIAKIGEIARKIGQAFSVTGPFNLQLIAKNDHLFVIECNLRVSRSFPFVSKTLEYDFVGLATKAMLYRGSPEQFARKHVPQSMPNKIGVKVAQFSFSRLAGAEVLMGVEMRSTGEVACFGKTTKEAYVKALLSTGFKVPSKTIFISFGGEAQKKELEKSVQILLELGYQLLASAGTANYYNEKFKDANISLVEWDSLDEARKQIELMIILPRKGSGTYQQQASTCTTNGYRSRRLAVDSGISLITDLKCAKLFILAMLELRNKFAGHHDGVSQHSLLPPIDSRIDALSSAQLIRLPGGIVDCHVHMREPGGEHKETWESGTKAAIAGGVTLILAMPNTNPPLVDADSYDLVDKLASKSALCDYALFVGATAENSEEAKIHICHVSSAEEIELIHEAKKMGHKITCEVCPHHLILEREQLPEGIREVRPRLNSSADCAALWAHLECCIDCFASDHAPHTLNEKNGKSPPPGFPGVELMLPLLLTAMSQGKCTLDQLVDKLIYAPRHIFGLPKPEPNTYVEIDLSEKWRVPENGGQSKAGWSPYAGQVLTGRVRTVVMRGQTIYVDGKFVETNNLLLGKNVLMEPSENGLEQMPPIAPSILLPKFFQQQLMPSSPSFTPAGPLIAGQQGNRPNKWFGKHVLRVEQFDRGMLHQLFAVANQFEKDEFKTYFGQLKKMIGALAFFEPSTRTKCSFMNAINELDGRICDMPSPELSSTKKGESLEDTIKTLCHLENKFIVLRHPEVGAAERAVEAAKGTNVCIINAGDGVGQHPTQALLDVYTIRKKLSTVNNKRIAIVGDLLNGRTAHSLAKILCLYKNISINYVAPDPQLQMPDDVLQYVAKNSNFKQSKFESLKEGIAGVDVIYMTRIQQERFKMPMDEQPPSNFVLTSAILEENMDSIVMHPMPRNNEIDTALDNDKRTVIFDQMRNGLYIRMALLKLMLIEQ